MKELKRSVKDILNGFSPVEIMQWDDDKIKVLKENEAVIRQNRTHKSMHNKELMDCYLLKDKKGYIYEVPIRCVSRGYYEAGTKSSYTRFEIKSKQFKAGQYYYLKEIVNDANIIKGDSNINVDF